MKLIKEIHNKNDTIIGYKALDIGGLKLLRVELVSLFHWFRDASAVDIYLDYEDDMSLLYVIKSYLRFKAIQNSTSVGKKAPDDVEEGW